jgi:hypothetical protein
MTDLLQQASIWLEEKRAQHAAQSVCYVRGSQLVNMPATIGKTTFEVDDGYGVLVRSESRDFLVLAADLLLDGKSTLPQRGDQIRETQSQQFFVYEVTAPGKEPCWRYSDLYRQTLRIHTKQVATETAS